MGKRTLPVALITVAILSVLIIVIIYTPVTTTHATTFTFTAPDDAKIFVHKWEPTMVTPIAAVQIIHGAGEHSLRYERFAEFLNKAGYVVYAVDNRGHGETAMLSGSGLGVAGDDAWNNMVKDEKQLTDIIQEDYPGLPIFLIGHSMGSLIAQDYMERWGNGLNGVVLTGTTGFSPNLNETVALAEQLAQGNSSQEPSPIFQQMFASFNEQFAPGETGFEWLSRDDAEVQKYINDPLCGFTFSNSLMRDFMKGLQDIWQPEKEALIPHDLPVLMLSGSLDPASGNTVTVMMLIGRYESNGMQELTYKFYPEARHEILNEINRDEVQQDIVDWLNGLVQNGS